ncbi:1-phosphofructokinase family hexose kinase [Micromonospora sp. NPDC047548]|uniref:1-phosphofructokinase family hexose kinase n=1 Tax=Micromonospora sp. NPDC047548 TaxID=3155624 RepID=UPI0033DC3A3C
MIVTLTLNPSLDRTMEITELVRGDVIRATAVHLEPGGKGVNVSRALLANGVPSRAVLPCGGDDGAELVRLLVAAGVEVRAIPISGRTRSNITIAEPDGTITKINEPGPELTADEVTGLTDRALTEAGPGGCVVLCGSAPPGLPMTDLTALYERVVAAGDRLVVDTSGPALRAAAVAGADLVKPNRDEVAEVVGRSMRSLDDVVEAARELRSWGAGTVLASLGADGAVLVDDTGVLVGSAPVPRPRSSVGAGDALLAGFLTRWGAGPARGRDLAAAALAEGLAWGAAAVSLPGSRMPGPADIERDSVRLDTRPEDLRRLLTPN